MTVQLFACCSFIRNDSNCC